MKRIYVVYWWWINNGKRDRTRFVASTTLAAAETWRRRILLDGEKHGVPKHKRVVSDVTLFVVEKARPGHAEEQKPAAVAS